MAKHAPTPSMLVRVGLTPEEWEQIQALARELDVSAKKLITDAIRSVLLERN